MNPTNTRNEIEDRVEAGRERAATRIRDVADTIRERTHSTQGRVVEFADRAADRMNQAADYMSTHDFRAMCRDAEGFLRKYPSQSVVAAIVLGMLAGRALRHREA